MGWSRSAGCSSATSTARTSGGRGRDEYFFSTDLDMTPQQIIEACVARPSIEVTFARARAHLGVATPRNRCEQSVLRTFPCLLGLFSVVALIFADLHRRGGTRPRQIPGYAKQEPTFVDALAAVRRELWREILQAPAQAPPCDKPPPPTPDLLLEHLSYAA